MTATTQGRCACCRQPIAGASNQLLGVHAVCWAAAGGRVRKVGRAAIERQHRAEIAAWVAEYVATEAIIASAIEKHREGRA